MLMPVTKTKRTCSALVLDDAVEAAQVLAVSRWPLRGCRVRRGSACRIRPRAPRPACRLFRKADLADPATERVRQGRPMPASGPSYARRLRAGPEHRRQDHPVHCSSRQNSAAPPGASHSSPSGHGWQAPEQRLVAREQLAQRVDEQTLAEAARAREEIVIGPINQFGDDAASCRRSSSLSPAVWRRIGCRWEAGGAAWPGLIIASRRAYHAAALERLAMRDAVVRSALITLRKA